MLELAVLDLDSVESHGSVSCRRVAGQPRRLCRLVWAADWASSVETQEQAADQVSIGNSIGSLRLLGAMNWREFIESLSGVEQTLRSDPAGDFIVDEKPELVAEVAFDGLQETAAWGAIVNVIQPPPCSTTTETATRGACTGA